MQTLLTNQTRINVWGTVLFAVIALTACSASPPVRYYTLQNAARSTPERPLSVSPQRTAANITNSDRKPFVLQILPVKISPTIDLPQLLVRSNEGEVALLENDRWVGPLGDEVRSALVSQLTGVLKVPEGSSLDIPQDLPIYRLQVDVTRFDSVRGRYVLQDTNWSLRQIIPTANGDASPSAPMLLCATRQIVHTEGDSTGALVRAHQLALEQLGLQIAETASQPPSQWVCGK